MRRSSLQLAMNALVRSAGAMAQSEPMLRQGPAGRQDRLDIDVTYGETRVMMDVTVAATCKAEVRKLPFKKIEPGCATRSVVNRKTQHYKEAVEAQRKELQIIAFDSAGCPAPETGK